MKTITLFAVLTSLTLGAVADTETFDFKDPKGVNSMAFQTDAPLETINGLATNVAGTVAFDAAQPAAVKGKIVVKSASLRVQVPLMQTHLQSAMWLDVEKYPDITFETSKVENVKTKDNVTTADITGTMALHGVSKEVTAKGVTFTFLKDQLKGRTGTEGDLLLIRANFTVKRSDFGINKGQMEDKVSDEIQLKFTIAGQAPH